MKILMVTSSMEPGGCETHVEALSAALTRMGHTVHLASAGGAIADLGTERGSFVSHVLPLDATSPLQLFKAARSLSALIRRERFAVIHAHTRPTALLLHLMGAAPLVTTAHWTFCTDFPKKQFTRWGEATLAVSADIADYLQKEYRLPKERITVTCNGVDPRRFFPAREGITRELVHVSRLDAGRALAASLLISLMPTLAKRHPDLTLTVIGDGDCAPILKREAERINRALGRRAILVTGAVADPAPYLRKRPLFVGVSRAAQEAMASGCPVVLCGDEGMLPEFDARREEAVAQAAKSNFCCRGCAAPTAMRLYGEIERLLSLKAEELLALGNANRRLVCARFTEETMARDALSVYRKVRRTVLCGYYGKGNLGDGLSKAALERQLGGRVESLFVSPSLPLGLPRLLRFMRPGTRFVLGGGTLLQNQTSNRSLAAYTAAFDLARAHGCVTELRSAGIGTLAGEWAKGRARAVLEKADLVELRTRSDLEAALELCPRRRDFYLGHDAALDLPLPPRKRSEAPFAVVALRESPLLAEQEKRQLVGLLKELGRQGIRLRFLIAHPEKDAALSAEMAFLAGGELCEKGKEEEALLGAEAVFTMRLHPALVALRLGIPSFAFATDEKLPALWRDLEELAGGGNPALSLLTPPFSPRDGTEIARAAGRREKEILALASRLRARRERASL